MPLSTYWHVTSSLNRASIRRHGLDWRFMSLAPGIAGSRRPEQEGCFLCRDEFELSFFVQMNNTGGTIDVWEVADLEQESFVESSTGFAYYPGVIGTDQIRLLHQDLPGGR